MLKFFRKIRYKLIQKNKIGKFLTYAVGEIVLVVIGILIALQINNWNHQYKNQKATKSFLLDFKRDLQTDIESLSKRIDKNTFQINIVDSIILTIATKKELSKNEIRNFWEQHIALTYESYFIPEKVTIRQFESGNYAQLNLTKTLKDKLFKYYSENERMEMNGEKSVQLYQHNFISEGIIQPILSGETLEIAIGFKLDKENLDITALKKNASYIWSLGTKKMSTITQTSKYTNIKAMAEELIVLIDHELSE